MASPEVLGQYRLKRLLGRGQLGQIWEASDVEEHGRKVALKIMHAADDELAHARSQFARDGYLASRLRHPNVVAVDDVGEAAGTSFLVMEMVEGTSLRSVMRDGSATMEEKLQWLLEIADGLSAMHRVGLAHRDLKPENVIVREDRTACLVDLGMSKWLTVDALTGEREADGATHGVRGPARRSSAYAPPETVERQVYDELGDQFAFGVLAYELLSGSPPANGSPSLSVCEGVPRRAAAALERARSHGRQGRWQRMDLLLEELADRGTSEAPRGHAPVNSDWRAQASRDSAPAKAPEAAEVAPPGRQASRGCEVSGRRVLIVAVVVAAAALAASLSAFLR